MSKTRDQIQQEALQAWIDSGHKGTIELATGTGKTKVSLDACKLLPKSAKILFLAETKQREVDLRTDQKKFKATGWNIEFACYQSAWKWEGTKWDLVICDEIHELFTIKRYQFIANNKYKWILGMSATVDRSAKVDREDSGNFLTKGELLDSTAPVCYTYTLDDGLENKTSRELDVYIIYHQLDSVTKNIEGGNKTKKFMTTEYATYNFYDNRFKKAMFLPMDKKAWAIPLWARKRADLLYRLPSKTEACKKLLKALKLKTIVFGNNLDVLSEITPYTVSSKRSDKENDEIRDKFNKGKIKTIGSFKLLKQGANLKDLDACIIHSYYSKELDIIQRLGRLRYKDKKGHVFIFVTNGTKETEWFEKMTENINSLNMIPCMSVDDAIKKFKSN